MPGQPDSTRGGKGDGQTIVADHVDRCIELKGSECLDHLQLGEWTATGTRSATTTDTAVGLTWLDTERGPSPPALQIPISAAPFGTLRITLTAKGFRPAMLVVWPGGEYPTTLEESDHEAWLKSIGERHQTVLITASNAFDFVEETCPIAVSATERCAATQATRCPEATRAQIECDRRNTLASLAATERRRRASQRISSGQIAFVECAESELDEHSCTAFLKLPVRPSETLNSPHPGPLLLVTSQANALALFESATCKKDQSCPTLPGLPEGTRLRIDVGVAAPDIGTPTLTSHADHYWTPIRPEAALADDTNSDAADDCLALLTDGDRETGCHVLYSGITELGLEFDRDIYIDRLQLLVSSETATPTLKEPKPASAFSMGTSPHPYRIAADVVVEQVTAGASIRIPQADISAPSLNVVATTIADTLGGQAAVGWGGVVAELYELRVLGLEVANAEALGLLDECPSTVAYLDPRQRLTACRASE